MKAIYQFKITLAGTRPSIWRHVLVPAKFTLVQLHKVLRACFAWRQSHLYAFELNHELYDDDAPKSLTKKPHQLPLGLKSKFKYVYDFWDNCDMC